MENVPPPEPEDHTKQSLLDIGNSDELSNTHVHPSPSNFDQNDWGPNEIPDDNGSTDMTNSIDAGSRFGDVGGVRSIHSRTNKPIGNVSSGNASNNKKKTNTKKQSSGVIWTRAPPKKSYEPDPFLSIDNLPADKKKLPSSSKVSVTFTSNKKSVSSFSRGPKVPYNSPAPALSRVSSGMSRPSSRPSTLSGWNSIVPRRNKYLPVQHMAGSSSHHIKQPFKQIPVREDIDESPRPTSPGQQMKDQTVMATYHVARTFAKQKPVQDHVISGRLLKAKLKPLGTAKVEGPSIHQCRGIVADPHAGLERSRTFQRRKQVIAQMGNQLITRPETGDSLHTTSIASEEEEIDELREELEMMEQSAQEAYQRATEEMPDAPESNLSPLKATSTTKTHRSEVFLTEDEIEGVVEGTTTKQEDTAVEGKNEVGAGDSLAVTPIKHSAGSRPVSNHGDSRPATQGSNRKVRFSAEGERMRSGLSKSNVQEVELMQEMEGEDLLTSGDPNANNNNSSRQEPLRMSISDLNEGFGKPSNIYQRKPIQKQRPRSGRAIITEALKPDYDLSDMNISGKHQNVLGAEEEDNCQIMVKVTKKKNRPESPSKVYVNSQAAAARAFGRSTSPKRYHGGPKEFMRAEKLRYIERARPQSALVMYYDMEIEPAPKPLQERPLSPNKNIGLGGKHASGKRITSAPVKRQQSKNFRTHRVKSAGPQHAASRSQTRCTKSHTHDPRIPVNVQCCECTKRMKKYLSEEEFQNKDNIRCKNCETLHGIVQQYNVVANVESSQNTHMLDQAMLAIEYPQTDDDLKEEFDEEGLDIIEDEVASDEEIQDFELLTDIDAIEKSLLQCRKDLQLSHARAASGRSSSPSPADKKVRFADEEAENDLPNDIFITENTNVPETKKVEDQIDQLADILVKGAISSVLTDCKQLPPHTPAVKPLVSQLEIHYQKVDLSEQSIAGQDASSIKDEDDPGELENQGLLEMLCEQMPLHHSEVQKKTVVKEKPLEVKASPAKMTRARKGSQMPPSIAPFSPLCFKINARPPAGFLYYFAYGLDMNQNRFATYIQRENADRYWGLLFGFKLAFNKKAVDEDAGCFPNIAPYAGSSVEGCLYLITPAELDLLDKQSGYPQQLEHLMLPVHLLNCDSPSDLGVAQYCIPALMYIAKDHAVHQDPSSTNSSYAVDQCIKAGDILSPAYRDHLEQMRR